ncbi:ankyrin repeat domain-containing protein [Mycoplasmatota bacterium]|nr:ankyrin repeat domain-containing protein [Mycoplasmatota bacterium]
MIFKAAATNNVLVVEYLVEHNLADINFQNSFGYTSLMFASRTNCKETIEYLLQNDANIELKNEDGETALDIAIARNNQEIVSLLSE